MQVSLFFERVWMSRFFLFSLNPDLKVGAKDRAMFRFCAGFFTRNPFQNQFQPLGW
jgi:hypothetical protein